MVKCEECVNVWVGIYKKILEENTKFKVTGRTNSLVWPIH